MQGAILGWLAIFKDVLAIVNVMASVHQAAATTTIVRTIAG
jgi:hypothetical protein